MERKWMVEKKATTDFVSKLLKLLGEKRIFLNLNNKNRKGKSCNTFFHLRMFNLYRVIEKGNKNMHINFQINIFIYTCV